MRGTRRVVAWTVLLACVPALAVAVVVPRVAGATPYAVLTGSMRPGLPPGTLVVVRPVPAEEIAVGDVVTYQLESGQPEVVTHRVVAITTDLGGETRFVTQGDANDVADAEPVRAIQVRGRLWYHVPYLGHLHALLSGAQHRVLVWVAAGCLLGYAMAMFALAARDRRRRTVPPHRATVGHG